MEVMDMEVMDMEVMGRLRVIGGSPAEGRSGSGCRCVSGQLGPDLAALRSLGPPDSRCRTL